MIRVLKPAAPLALLFSLVLGSTAFASTKDVSIVSFSFSPTPVKVAIGSAVRWTNNDTVTHTSTSDGTDACCPDGTSLWASGPLAPNGAGTFLFTFPVAGTFTYHCSIHTSMRGTVQVSMKANPKTGTTITQFTIMWASAAGIPSGYTADVQIMRPDGNGWVAWKTGESGTQVKAKFTPDAGAGTYQFRTHLNNTSTAKSSGFSKPTSITVTP
jgi:plastocyanin